MDEQPPPRPIGRRARNRAARAAFVAARKRGLTLRHRAKLEHLRDREPKEDDS